MKMEQRRVFKQMGDMKQWDEKLFSKSATHLKHIWIYFGKCEDTTVAAPAGTMHCVMPAAEQLPLASSRPSVPEWEMPLHIYNARPPTPQQAVTTAST